MFLLHGQKGIRTIAGVNSDNQIIKFLVSLVINAPSRPAQPRLKSLNLTISLNLRPLK